MSRKSWYEFLNGMKLFMLVMAGLVLPFTAFLSFIASPEKAWFCLFGTLLCILVVVFLEETLSQVFRNPWSLRELKRHIRFPEYRPAYEFRTFGERDLDFVHADWFEHAPPLMHERYYHPF